MRRKILIVDDVDVNRAMLKKILDSEYDILEASDGEEALLTLHRNYKMLSAILLDLIMPVMDGYEVLRSMRDNVALSQIPVVVVTGAEEEEVRVRALVLGANDFVTKPYNPEVIRHCLHNSINLRETASIVNAIQRDKLTGLYCREAFFEKVRGALSSEQPGSFVMACFDIDNFKLINDQYGAVEGDRILKYVGAQISAAFQYIGGISGRISGDNFAGIFPNTPEAEAHLSKCRDTKFIPADFARAISFSAGRYVITDCSLSVSAMYDRAYIAKQSVKGMYDKHLAYFDESMLDKLLQEQQIIGDMGSALTENQFEVWFQPQMNYATGALIGAEALVRWKHPTRGLISPAAFIPIFEQNGFIYELDKYVWEQTCFFLRKWIDEGRNPLPVSVNISRYDIFKEDLLDIINGLIQKYNLSVSLLRLEVTESAFATSSAQIIQVVKRLMDCGYTIEIDDFGSGYSSLNTLKDVPANVLKLDMKFLKNDGDAQRGGNIVESIVRMAKWLGMSVLAEGVEEKAQADFLKSIGCSYIQGYLYAKPMPVADYEIFAHNVGKEEKMMVLQTVENLDNNAFWNPESMDTLIFNSYVGGACIFEYHDGKIEVLRSTDKFAKVLGGANMTVEDVLKLDFNRCLSKESLEKIHEVLERSIQNREEISEEYVFFNVPGCSGKIDLRSTMRVIASAGNCYLVYSTSENITALRQAEQQLKLLMNSIPGGIATYEGSPDHMDEIRLTYFSDGFCRLFGYTRAEFEKLSTIHPFGLVLQEDLSLVQTQVNALVTEKMPMDCVYRAHSKDGDMKWINVKALNGHKNGCFFTVNAVLFDITARQNAVEQLRVSEEANRMAIRHTGHKICHYNVTDHTLILPETDAIFHVSTRMEDVPYAPIRRKEISSDTADAYLRFYESILRGEKEGAMVYQRASQDGWRWLEAHFTTIFSHFGTPISAVISYGDVTEQMNKEAVFKKWKQSLQDRSDDSYTLFRCNLSKEAFYDSVNGSLLRARFNNPESSFDECTLEYVKRFVYEKDVSQYLSIMKADTLLANYYRGKRSDQLDYRENNPDGTVRWLRLTLDMVEYPNSTDVEIFLMYENIDEEKRVEIQTKMRAETDDLTGVLNRAAFAERVDSIIRESPLGTQHALLMLDLDGFKLVNDAFGHDVGDQALVDTAHRICSVVREDDLVGRLGGDEFVVFVNGIPNDSTAASKAQDICMLTRRAYSAEVQISQSIGISICPRDGKDFAALYKKADEALYHVKGSGKNDFTFYRDDLENERLKPLKPDPESQRIAPDIMKHRMLIVENNSSDFDQMAKLFKHEFVVDHAMNGKAALTRLRHYGCAISVVVLNLNMPDMDGFSILREMQNNHILQTIPVVAIGTDGQAETSLQAVRLGASDFVSKPLDAELLRLRVLSAISKSEMARLRVQNNFLQLQNDEIERYRVVLHHIGLAIIEYNWVRSTFTYDKNVNSYLAGLYDGRKLWHILLSDMVADTATVQKMQGLLQCMATERDCMEKTMFVQLKTPSRVKHWFRMTVYKKVNEYQLTEKLIMTFFDLGAELPNAVK